MLDYIEGLLLGRIWSDTDFENRKHVSLFILYGLLVDASVLYFFIKNKYLFGMGQFASYQLVLLVVLFLACPFINFRYYKFPWWGKTLVLIEKIYKNLLIYSLVVGMLIPRITISSGNLKDYLINYLNYTLEEYTGKFSASAGAFSTVIGVMAGGIHVVLYFIGNLAVLIVVPALLYLAFRLLQYGYDYVIDKVIIKKVFKHK